MRLSLTPTGRALLVLTAAGYLAAWLLGYDAAFMVVAAFAAAVVLGLLWVLPGRHLSFDQVLDQRAVTAGDAAHGTITLRDPPARRVLPITLEDRVGAREVRRTLGRRDDAIRYDIPTDRRGVFPVGPARVCHRDPLGLWERCRTVGAQEDLWVYPRAHVLDVDAVGRRDDVEGTNAQFATQGTVAFHSLREYHHGDDLRAVHWKTSARTGTLMVRQQSEAGQPRTTIVLDTRLQAHTDASFEVAVEVAASLVVSVVGMVRPIELRTTSGTQVGALSVPTSAPRFLEALAEVTLTDEGSFALVDEALRDSTADTLFFVTSSAVADDDRAALAPLGRRLDAITIIDVRPELGPYLPPAAGTRVVEAPTADELVERWRRRG